jgi:hypothetical protein
MMHLLQVFFILGNKFFIDYYVKKYLPIKKPRWHPHANIPVQVLYLVTKISQQRSTPTRLQHVILKQTTLTLSAPTLTHITTVNGTTVNSTTGNITTVNSTNVVASTSVTSPVYQVAGLQVVSFRQAAIANAGAVGAVYVQAEVQEIVDQLNAILSALRAHGLIAV